MKWIKQYTIDMDRLPKSLLINSTLMLIISTGLLLTILLYMPIQETVEGEVTILTNGQAVQIKAPTSGRMNLQVSDQRTIAKGDFLAMVNTDVAPHDFILAEDIVKDHLYYFNFDQVDLVYQNLSTLKDLRLTDLNQEVISLLDLLQQHKLVTRSYDPGSVIATLDRSKANKTEQIQHYKKLEKAYVDLLDMMRTQLAKDSVLYLEGGISLREYESRKQAIYEREATLIQNQLNEQTLAGEIINYDKLTAEERRQYRIRVEELKLNILDQVGAVRQAFQAFRKRHTITSPTSGKVRLPRDITDGQMVAADQNILQITADQDQETTAYILIPRANAGKVRIGHQVRIQLAEFGAREFGSYYADIIGVDELLVDDQYRVYLDVETPITTSYQMTLPLRQRYTGQGEVLLGKLNLWTKIWRQLRYTRETVFD